MRGSRSSPSSWGVATPLSLNKPTVIDAASCGGSLSAAPASAMSDKVCWSKSKRSRVPNRNAWPTPRPVVWLRSAPPYSVGAHDAAYVGIFAERVGVLFPGCPHRGAASHCRSCVSGGYSGRIGRSAAAKELESNAVRTGRSRACQARPHAVRRAPLQRRGTRRSSRSSRRPRGEMPREVGTPQSMIPTCRCARPLEPFARAGSSPRRCITEQRGCKCAASSVFAVTVAAAGTAAG